MGTELVVDGVHVPTDAHGYLRHRDDWTEAVAEAIAAGEGISLSAEHWQVINFVRSFYHEYHSSPAIRPLIKYLGQHWPADRANSLYLHKLFKEPAKQASKIAGLPKPARCI